MTKPRTIEPNCVCYHEAGHAVVADEFGLRVHALRIDAGGGMDVNPAEERELPLEHRLAICAGGAAAERLLNCTGEHDRTGADRRWFKKLLAKGDNKPSDVDAAWELTIERTMALLTPRRVTVKRLATELQNGGPSLSEDQVVAVLRLGRRKLTKRDTP